MQLMRWAHFAARELHPLAATGVRGFLLEPRKISKMNSNEIILKFVAFLAHVRAMFRQFHLFAEKSPALHSVSTMVIPFKGDPSDYADDGVTISIATISPMITSGCLRKCPAPNARELTCPPIEAGYILAAAACLPAAAI